ncbi:small conductance mechanosensitive channel [Desulfohalotomaculum tongense]|uniref:mechanosensitive ion channel family protein n=1 Tax=Desulforadius tongensis TaxID=1216062 RepID=UPI001956F5B2|nr:mechanosensitive ion channel family protein [Desulforadius tongensis]MBM7855416.1 small conductance mechanosensitive channel [Desulforadius tongensis]
MAEEKFMSLLEQVQWLSVIEKMVVTVAIIIISYILMKLRTKLIARIFKFTKMDENKERTLATMLMSFTRYVIYIIAVLLILKQFVDITPIIAGAGVVGLAIGFGAQSLVKDVITGFFVMFEDQFHVGDFVQINGEVTGTVEEIGLRMTTIREWSGKKFYIPNSEIRTVRNYNRRELRAIVSVTFPYEEDPVKVRELLEDVCRQVERDFRDQFLTDERGSLVEPPQVYGVTDINENDRGGTFTIIAKTKPASIWTVEKMLKEYIWRHCYQQGVKIAYPRRIYQEVESREAGTGAAGI